MVTSNKAAWAGRALQAASMLAMMIAFAPSAQAQAFFGFDPPSESPGRIVREIESEGYELRGPLLRHGDVYVADARGPAGHRIRLVIDARTGNIVERYPERGWDDERPLWHEHDLADGWDAPPRPPRPLSGQREPFADDEDVTPPPRSRFAPDQQVARGDPNDPPVVIYGDHGKPDGMINVDPKTDAQKPKPHVAKHKTTPTPTPSVAAVAPKVKPADTEPAPVRAPPETQVEATPETTTPAAPPVHVEPVNPTAEAPKVKVEPPKAVVEAPAPIIEAPKPVAQAPKPVVEAPKPVAAIAPVPKPTPKPKAVNDLPVSPLD